MSKRKKKPMSEGPPVDNGLRAAIERQKDGGTPALKAFKAEVKGKLDAAGCATLEEWAEKRPGEHLPAMYGKYPSCALCGAVEPYEGYQTACKGPNPIVLRNQRTHGKTLSLLSVACEAARRGFDQVVLLTGAQAQFDRILSLVGSLRREGTIGFEDIIRYGNGTATIRFVDGGGQVLVTTSEHGGHRWSTGRERVTGRKPVWINEQLMMVGS